MKYKMKTNMGQGNFVRAALLMLGIVFCFEIILELENFSKNAKGGWLVYAAKVITKPMGSMFVTSGVKPISRMDLDFPPSPDTMTDNDRMYADTAVRFK